MKYLLVLAVLLLPACPKLVIHKEICTRYVGCAMAIDTSAGKDVDLAYGPTSMCWSDDKQSLACVEACEAGIKELQANSMCKDEVKPEVK